MRVLALLSVCLALPSCLVRTTADAVQPNVLSDEERALGTRLLFDGESTVGWRGYRSESCPEGWQALDGALTRVAGAGDIVTEEEFDDFVLEFEWRVGVGSNSGVMFHVSEDHDAPWETGPEYQILDNVAHANGLDPRTSAASNYAMHAPLADYTRPAGDWNQSRLSVCGPVVEHWLNGERVVTYELWSEDWNARVAACKWKDRPDYGQRRRGRIALQDHGDWVAFRSIKLRPIRPAQ